MTALSRACPVCWVKPGEPCRSEAGAEVEPHRERTRPPCPRCGRPSSGSPWGGDHCGDHGCMVEEHNATPPHERRGSLGLTTRGPGMFAASVWTHLPSGRSYVIKCGETVGRLAGPARDKYIENAIGYSRKGHAA